MALISLEWLIKCKLAKDSFFKLPPVITLLAAVNMALLDEVKDELFRIDAAENEVKKYVEKQNFWEGD